MEDDPENSMASLISAMSQAFEQISAAVVQVVERITLAIRHIYTALEEKYQEAGAPYGESHEGLMRWLHDMGEINHKQHHEMLVSARKLGEEIRRRHQSEVNDGQEA